MPTIGEAQRTPLRAKLEQRSSEAKARKAKLTAWPRQLSPLLKRGILYMTIQIMIQGGAQIATGVLQKIGYGKPLGGTVGGQTKENILQLKPKRRPSKTT